MRQPVAGIEELLLALENLKNLARGRWHQSSERQAVLADWAQQRRASNGEKVKAYMS